MAKMSASLFFFSDLQHTTFIDHSLTPRSIVFNWPTHACFFVFCFGKGTRGPAESHTHSTCNLSVLPYSFLQWILKCLWQVQYSKLVPMNAATDGEMFERADTLFPGWEFLDELYFKLICITLWTGGIFCSSICTDPLAVFEYIYKKKKAAIQPHAHVGLSHA